MRKNPADHVSWQQLRTNAPLEDLRMQALNFIAVPWRKFYRRTFVEHHNLRYPEGDFFFEDNPFHWAVCLAANTIRFFDVTICHHRINRPGQTMASTGRELIAFFIHFETILAMGKREGPVLEADASRWLVSNMAWHMNRLQTAAQLPYFTAAAAALAMIDESVWNREIANAEDPEVRCP